LNNDRLALVTMTVYLWVMWILLGSIVLETFMIYPNIFRDVPSSLEEALRFMSVRAPGDFFPPLGLVSWVSGAASALLAWKVKDARYFVVSSVLLIVLDGAISMAFAWPRNATMFVEGKSVHSAEALRQTAREFQMLHWARLMLSAAASAVLFAGYLRFYRHTLALSDERATRRPRERSLSAA
jgi:hypothetical protein